MALLRSPLPAELGYRMPAEWEPQEATWLAWPHNEASWPGKIEPVPAVYAEIVRALTPHQKVRLCVPDEDRRAFAEEVLRTHGAWGPNVELHVIPTNDSWARDHGPIFVTDGRTLRFVKWEYNAWGGKYPPFDLDNAVPLHVAERFGFDYWRPGIVMEGGSIDVNGRGTLLTTEACLLNPNRNPHLTKAEIEKYLCDYLGVRHILWLGDGIVGDDTDGHVDDLTRFVDAQTVVTAVEDDPADENYAVLQDNLHRLRTMRDQDGRPLRVVELPMPAPVVHEDRRLPASYANFLIANGVVLLPTYRCANDKRAVDILQELMPDRRVVPIDCTDLVWGLGAIHCISQQQPKRPG